MRIVMPTENQGGWVETLGVSRDVLIEKMLVGGWLAPKDNPDAVLVVSELQGVRFGLGFHWFASTEDIQKVRFTRDFVEKKGYRIGRYQFDLIFNYKENAENILIHEVHFEDKNKGLGTTFLARTLDMLLDLGGSRLYAEPAFDGSVFWTRRGFLLQRWPTYMDKTCLLKAGILKILNRFEGVQPVGWHDDDIGALKCAFESKDYKKLNELVVRDLMVARPLERFSDLPEISLCDFLLHNVPLELNVCDLTQPLTKACLLQRMGYDVDAKCAKRGLKMPARPENDRALAYASYGME